MISPVNSGRRPLISIVTPSYNQGMFLEEAIKSVIFQDYANVEYIIIDGGSTDESLNIIHKYESRISYWQSRTDKGQANAINIGFKKATGEILAWLNADDMYMPGTLQCIADEFNKYPNTDLIYGDCVFIDEQGNFIRYFTECEDYDAHRLLNYSNFIMQPTTFFSQKKLIEVGFLDESFFYAMDYELWCRFTKNNAKFKFMQRVLAANRVYSETKTSSGGIKRLREIYRLQKRYMTGFWPHAFWGFTATEIYNQGLSSGNRLIEYIFKFLGSVIALLSPKAVFYSCKNQIRKKIKYGLYPHSSICFGTVSIYLPFYNSERYEALDLELGIDEKMTHFSEKFNIRVRFGGEPFKIIALSTQSKRQNVKIPINMKSKNNKEILIEIDFGKKITGNLYSVRFCKSSISAKIK